MCDDSLSNQIRQYAERMSEDAPSALAGLFDLTAQRLVRFSITITRNQHDAEDAVQAALMSAVARPAMLTNAQEPWHYLLRMVRNESLIVLRKKRRWTLGLGIGDLLAYRAADGLEQEDMHREVLKALRSIPLEQRQVVVLKIWEELTFQEIAEVLECSLQTAASRFRYAIQKLAPKLVSLRGESVRDG
ncbi:RNA polymerase sigma factor SigV [Pirellula sp. SH-Sr6A]|uniref:RNA polymerase sigma factor n=1 Tax=Pirellula sp. SH-Sr6A TaxID=1632865 RepID=UPI00078E95CF|nr:sigma-70 family RNA polymerase sigma factor [Pirellula sp. SH-Sr6A]AMV32417.1 RNA polymerase sigma factor SigV [Pirellula sp. SH-Sr6A]